MTDEVVIQTLTNKVNFINEEVERTGNNLTDLIVCIDAEVLVHALGFIHRQKAEIERLTEKEHERIAWSKQEYLDWVHGFLSTHTEMKDRGEKYEMFDRDWMCNVFWAKIKGSIEYIIDLENQRNNLQKQVDELREERYYTEQDTAKEIYGWLKAHTFSGAGWEIVKAYFREKGVEVE